MLYRLDHQINGLNNKRSKITSMIAYMDMAMDHGDRLFLSPSQKRKGLSESMDIKQFFFLAFIFGVVAAFGDQAKPNVHSPDKSIAQMAPSLHLTLLSTKRSYKPSDQFKLEVMLRNAGAQPLYVFGTLEWGYSASLMFHIRDASGKEIEPTLIPDPPPHAPPEDKSDFVKLQPDYFLGTSYFAPMKLMNLTKSGKYLSSWSTGVHSRLLMFP